MALINEFADAFWFVLPAYFASISPVWFGLEGKLRMDFEKEFRGKRVFGTSKTVRGFFGGALCGTALGALQQLLFNESNGLVLGLLLGFGAMTGELVKSFFKRQRGIPPGRPWFPFDQLDFLIGGLAFAALVETPTLLGVVILIIITPPLHILSNIVDFKLGLKKVPN